MNVGFNWNIICTSAAPPSKYWALRKPLLIYSRVDRCRVGPWKETQVPGGNSHGLYADRTQKASDRHTQELNFLSVRQQSMR